MNNWPLPEVARRNALQSLSGDSHLGLWFTRFFGGYDEGWKVGDNAKAGFISTVAGLSVYDGHRALSEQLAARTEKLCQVLGGESFRADTRSPFVTGLGLDHPVENGLTLHPLSGQPYLPAAAVKGLLRAWVDVWMPCDDQEQRKGMSRFWFGDGADSADSAQDSHAGHLVFFDALPTGVVEMECDVMTPHMGDWYQSGQDLQAETDAATWARTVPADWHSPVPVPFLVARAGATFQFCLAPRLTGDPADDELARQAVKAAAVQLKLALQWIGAGAKTASGYGRMEAALVLQAQGEEWSDVELSYVKNLSTLQIVNKGNPALKTAAITRERAAELMIQLSEADQARLKKRNIKVTARVEKKGAQQYTVLSIASKPA